MISTVEASNIVFSNLGDFGVESVDLLNATKRILAEEIYADRPFPPFDRVMMDGIAFSYTSWKSGKRSFVIESAQYAGEAQLTLNNGHACIEVMTGAMLPKGTDVVVPVELVEVVDNKAKITAESVDQFQHIHRQGQDKQQGDLLLSEGLRISPAEIATLATVGKSKVMVKKLPKVAVISTGDELVEVDQSPKPYQIRKSNVFALATALSQDNIVADFFHLNDVKEEITKELSMILEKYDVVLMSGGVSKGKKDYVPEVLGKLGVEKLFHRVKQRPGKPFWFGKYLANTFVFALPGNPVSTFMCYYRYVRPWILKSLNIPFQFEEVALAADFEFKRDLTYFLQVKVENEEGNLKAIPVQGQGSGDLANLNQADGFMELPYDKTSYAKGNKYPLIRYRD